MKSRNKLILEFTEFNLQRFNSDSVQVATHVDNPQLSTNAFDKHQDAIRQAMSRIDDILFNIKGTSSYSTLRSKLSLEQQDVQKIKIQRITKTNGVHFDVYLTIMIQDEEYWGKIVNILGLNTKFHSEVFKDNNLYQPKEWVIKTKGVVVNTVKAWLKPEPGKYRLLNDEVICYSVDTGKQLRMMNGIEVELIRSYDDKIIIKHENDYYNLVDDNYIYFNWWFEKIQD
jgi:hypothetical protein